MSRIRDNLVPFTRTPDYWMMRAGKHKNNAEHSAAGYLYRKAFEQSPKVDIALNMAENYYQMGCFSASRRIAVELLKNNRSNALAYYWLGMTALKDKDEDLGEQALALALKKGADLPVADEIQDILSDYPWNEPLTYRRSQRSWCLYEKALRELNSGMLLKAEVYLRRSVCRGICPEAEALLGELLFCRMQYSSSIRYLRRASVRISNHPSVWILLAQAYKAMSMNAEAAQAFAKAIPLIQTSREWGMTAAASFFLNCHTLVYEALKNALRFAPESNDLLFVLAAIEANSGQLSSAVRHLNAILARDPDDRDAEAALSVIGYAPVPFFRMPDDAQLLNELCSEPCPAGDHALKRLAHGLTISMGGALTYTEVLGITSNLWSSLNQLQRRMCDLRNEWPNAFYRMLCNRYRVNDLPRTAALWPLNVHERRIRRMSKYLNKSLKRMEVNQRGRF